MKSNSAPSPAVAFLVILAAIFLLHLPLLRLPYFWDEAGYYIPAARDLLLAGSVIPHSTPSNAHPPLVMAYLAACWKVAGFSLFVTRTAMLVVAAFSLLGVFRLGQRVANLQVAVAATACTALYPVFFAQSTMAHVDLAAAGLTLWGLEAYLDKRWRAATVWFSFAVLAKETAVLAPLALLVWTLVGPWFERLVILWLTDRSARPDRESVVTEDTSRLASDRWKAAPSLLTSVVVLCLWYAYHYSRTGYVFGNPEFFRYNVQATMSGVRILLALVMRLWQSFGYMHLWVLSLLMAWAMTRPPLRDGDSERPRIDLAQQFVFGILILAYIAALAVVGGAVLARYMLTVVPLVILVAVSTLWRRIRQWLWLVGAVCFAFVVALFFNPPYGFSPEDNLAYRDYVLMHQEAESFLEQRYPKARVLTAWPASDEISRTYLGYVTRPMPVVRIEDFTADELLGAAQERSRFDVALVFSTKYEPPRPLLERWRSWEKLKTRFFGFHRDLPPAIAAQILGGRVVFIEKSTGQWVAVIELERVLDARLAQPNHADIR
ncbi:MAG TPA: glycosyltransferase family 39 protein [Terriglobales bacterium]|nr:glycosyltransferase family 39 protein [Terriglobales bacterium]